MDGKTNVLYDVWFIKNLVGAMLDDALTESGLSGNEYGLYSLLRAAGRSTPNEMVRSSGMRPTTLSGVLRRGLRRGELRRRKSRIDARSYVIELSATGVARYRVAQSAFRCALGAVNHGLGDAEGETRLALQRLDAVLRSVLGLEQRPYRLAMRSTTRGPDTFALEYATPALSFQQEDEARRFISWLRLRDGLPSSSDSGRKLATRPEQ